MKKTACNAGDPGLIPGSGRSSEKGMATDSSILAWRIPWTEEPGRLQSMGSQSQTQLEINRPSLIRRVTEKGSSFNKYTIYRIIICIYE